MLQTLATAINVLASTGHRIQAGMQDGRVVFRMVKVSGVTTEEQVISTIRWDPEAKEWKVEE
jgi:hypothetical protein